MQEAFSLVARYFSFDPSLLLETSIAIRLVIQALLLCGSGFFSGSETALFSLSNIDLQKLRRQRHPNSEIVHALLDQPRRLIISILCGNELVNIAATINLTTILVTLYGAEKAGVISVVVMLPLVLLIGEVTPKTLALSNPVRFGAGLAAVPLSLWVKSVTPLRWVIRSVSDKLTTWIVGEATDAENILQVDEFRTLVEEVAKGGELSATERALIHHLLDAGDTEVVEIMTPRTRMAFINASSPLEDIINRVRNVKHSRIPVYASHRDNVVGFLHAETVLMMVLDEIDLKLLQIDDIIHPVIVVPPTKKVDEMFDFFQNNHCRAAVVMNEFGGVDGLVTLTDVLNFIFGQISEAAIPSSARSLELGNEDYEVSGAMKLVDFENLTNFGLEDPRMTTVAGVAFRLLDRLPRTGDIVQVDDIELTILEMDELRIARLRARRVCHDTSQPDDYVEPNEPPRFGEEEGSAIDAAENGSDFEQTEMMSRLTSQRSAGADTKEKN